LIDEVGTGKLGGAGGSGPSLVIRIRHRIGLAGLGADQGEGAGRDQAEGEEEHAANAVEGVFEASERHLSRPVAREGLSGCVARGSWRRFRSVQALGRRTLFDLNGA
jgi:hypothetical protein